MKTLPQAKESDAGSSGMGSGISMQARHFGDGEQFIRAVFETNPEKGLELLFREYYRPLCSHAMRFVFSLEVARDLVADIFCDFLQKAHYKRVQVSYKYYLYRSVRNDCLKYLRDELGKSFLNLEAAGLSEVSIPETPESLMGYEELSFRIESAISQLPAQGRKIFLMARFEGKKHQLIADELHISIKTVEAHITRSLKAIRNAIDKEWS